MFKHQSLFYCSIFFNPKVIKSRWSFVNFWINWKLLLNQVYHMQLKSHPYISKYELAKIVSIEGGEDSNLQN